MSIRQQCDVLSISRSEYYYKNKGENELNIKAMHLMDRYIQEEPTAGGITMRSMLADREQVIMSYERVRRLMRKAVQQVYSRMEIAIAWMLRKACGCPCLLKVVNIPYRKTGHFGHFSKYPVYHAWQPPF